MNPYTMPVTCDVCGGEGVGTVRTAGAAWLADSTIAHNDPRVCRDYLAKMKREAEAAQKELDRIKAERDRWMVPA